MEPRLYGELTPWYRLLDPTADHADEAAAYQASFEVACPPAQTLLELGAGAGNNAYFLKQRYRCTLSEPSQGMRALSQQLNPDCEHVPGDMRSVRLGRVFDCVLVHDAVVYMTSEQDLRAAAETAFIHTRPGGAALFAPDELEETFAEGTQLYEADEGTRGLRCLEWAWRPHPELGTYTVDYAFLLREGAEMKVVHDRHEEGLFSTDTWQRVLASVGFEVSLVERPVGELERGTARVFLCTRP